MPKTNNLYLAMLKYGHEKLADGVSYREMSNHLERKGHLTTGMIVLFNDSFRRANNVGWVDYNTDPDAKCFMKAEGVSYLLEHQELEDARRSAKSATWFASIAIIISVISTSASIHFSLKQIETPITINNEQLNKLLNNNKCVKPNYNENAPITY